jgi:hypothetical protein
MADSFFYGLAHSRHLKRASRRLGGILNGYRNAVDVETLWVFSFAEQKLRGVLRELVFSLNVFHA